MLTKRIIPCLDVRDGKVTKGIRFKDNIELGNPIEMALDYSNNGADELVFYDITASAEYRPIDIQMVRNVARVVRIPFAVGGGIASLDDMYHVLMAGAEKISVNSLAVKNPQLIAEGCRAFGSQCIVLGMDPVKTSNRGGFPCGYEITVRGFREHTGLDALEWAKRAEDMGVGEIVVNSVDADGTREGFNISLTALVSSNVGVPVVASGGAGNPQHLIDVFTQGKADAAIVAGILHMGEYTISQIKNELAKGNIPVRRKW
jgi:cyclase